MDDKPHHLTNEELQELLEEEHKWKGAFAYLTKTVYREGKRRHSEQIIYGRHVGSSDPPEPPFVSALDARSLEEPVVRKAFMEAALVEESPKPTVKEHNMLDTIIGQLKERLTEVDDLLSNSRAGLILAREPLLEEQKELSAKLTELSRQIALYDDKIQRAPEDQDDNELLAERQRVAAMLSAAGVEISAKMIKVSDELIAETTTTGGERPPGEIATTPSAPEPPPPAASSKNKNVFSEGPAAKRTINFGTIEDVPEHLRKMPAAQKGGPLPQRIAAAEFQKQVLEVLEKENLTTVEISTKLGVSSSSKGRTGDAVRELSHAHMIYLTGEQRDNAPEWSSTPGYKIDQVPDSLKEMPICQTEAPAATQVMIAHQQHQIVELAEQIAKPFVISEFMDKITTDWPRSRMIDYLNQLADQGKFIKRTGHMRRGINQTAGRTAVEYVATNAKEVATKEVESEPAPPSPPAESSGLNPRVILAWIKEADLGIFTLKDISEGFQISDNTAARKLLKLIEAGEVYKVKESVLSATGRTPATFALTGTIIEEEKKEEKKPRQGADLLQDIRDEATKIDGPFRPSQVAESLGVDQLVAGTLLDLLVDRKILTKEDDMYQYHRPTKAGRAAEIDQALKPGEMEITSEEDLHRPVAGTGKKARSKVMPVDPNMRDIVKKCLKNKVRVTRTGDNHFRIHAPNRPVTIAGTPSSPMAHVKARRDLRAAGLTNLF